MYIYVSGREAVGSPRQPWPPGLRTTARAERERRLGAWQTQSQRRGSLSLAACILSRSPVPGTVPYEYPVATLLQYCRHSNGMTIMHARSMRHAGPRHATSVRHRFLDKSFSLQISIRAFQCTVLYAHLLQALHPSCQHKHEQYNTFRWGLLQTTLGTR